jgi:hypothetical protein
MAYNFEASPFLTTSSRPTCREKSWSTRLDEGTRLELMRAVELLTTRESEDGDVVPRWSALIEIPFPTRSFYMKYSPAPDGTFDGQRGYGYVSLSTWVEAW